MTFACAALAGIAGVVDMPGPVTGPVPVGVPVAGIRVVDNGIVAMVKVDTIDGECSKASTLGSSATPSPPVVDVPGVAGAAVVVVVVLVLVVVGAMVVVVDDAGTLVLVDVLAVVVVVVVVVGTMGRDSAWSRLRSVPAHCVVPAGMALTARVLSTGLAVRLLKSANDCGASGVPPVAAVERCTANGPTGQSSICGCEGR